MRTAADIAGLVLAAGYSSRMGTLKPLMRIGHARVVELAAGSLGRAGVQDITVVVGHKAGEITTVLEDLGVQWVLNADYEKGMLSSILTGIRSFKHNIQAFLMLPVDIPLVKPETVQALIRAYQHGAASVIYPVCGGRRGHPPLISLDCVRDLTAAHEGGMRSFLRRYESEALDVEVTDEGILMDFDTPEDYRAMQKGLDWR